jgi:hypothetical protein
MLEPNIGDSHDTTLCLWSVAFVLNLSNNLPIAATAVFSVGQPSGPSVRPDAATASIAATLVTDTLQVSTKPTAIVDTKAPCVAAKPTLWSTILANKGVIIGAVCAATLLAAPSLLGGALASGSALLLVGSGALVIGPSLALCAMFLSGAFSGPPSNP